MNAGGEVGVHLRVVHGEGIDKPVAILPHRVHAEDTFDATEVGAELGSLRSLEEPGVRRAPEVFRAAHFADAGKGPAKIHEVVDAAVALAHACIRRFIAGLRRGEERSHTARRIGAGRNEDANGRGEGAEEK